jgi:hypothetical protein
MKLLSLINKSYYSNDVIIRDYTDREYAKETNEYFKNANTKKVAPNAFDTKKEMIEKLKKEKIVLISNRYR